MSIDLSVPFNDPYIGGGTGGGGPLPPDQIGIDTRTYVIDTQSNDWRREGIEVLQQRNTNSNRDLLLLPQNVWRHQDESWHQGMGQTHKDRDDALPYRYLRSYGIDPWTKYEISLLPETEQIHTAVGTGPIFTQIHLGKLVVIEGGSSWWYDDRSSTPVELAFGTAPAAAIDVTYDGDEVIVLLDDGTIWYLQDETTAVEYTVTWPPEITAPDPTMIEFVKGFLIAASGPFLVDITAPTGVLIYQSIVTGWRWWDACEGPRSIYVVGGVNDKASVHSIVIKDDGTGLNPPFVAADLPDGETPNAIGGYLGFVFIGSDKGLRMAQPDGSGYLTLGALITTDGPVRCFEGQSRFVWVGVDSLNPLLSDGGTVAGCPPSPVAGLGRVDLSTFTTSEYTPAYAQDVVAADQPPAPVTDVLTWNLTYRVFALQGVGVYMDTDNRVPTGWLESGRVSFSVEDMKTGLYAQAKWEPLKGGIGVALSYDSKPPTVILNWAIQGSIRSGNVPLNGAQFSRVDPIYVLTRDQADPTQGPKFTRFELRARPAKGKASRWYIPIINHEELDLNGVIEARNVNTEFDRLIALVESGKMFTLQEGKRSYQAVAVDFKWFPQKLTTQGDGWQGVFVLICEEVR